MSWVSIPQYLATLEEENGNLSNEEVDEVLGVMGSETKTEKGVYEEGVEVDVEGVVVAEVVSSVVMYEMIVVV